MTAIERIEAAIATLSSSGPDWGLGAADHLRAALALLRPKPLEWTFDNAGGWVSDAWTIAVSKDGIFLAGCAEQWNATKKSFTTFLDAQAHCQRLATPSDPNAALRAKLVAILEKGHCWNLSNGLQFAIDLIDGKVENQS